MKNIYLKTDLSGAGGGGGLPSDATFNSLTTNTLTIPGGAKGDILFIGDNIGTIDGLNIGTVNDVLVSDGTIPQYTNALNVNTVRANSMRINGLGNGNLMVGSNGDGTFAQLTPGPIHTMMASDGSSWNQTDRLYANFWNGYRRELYIDNSEVQPKIANFCSNFSANNNVPIPLGIPSAIISGNYSYVAGKTYRIVFNALLNGPINQTVSLQINISQAQDFGLNVLNTSATSASGQPLHFERYYNCFSNYVFNYTIVAGSSSNLCSFTQPKIIIEEKIF